jgi:N-formylglutamate deformylase
MDLWTRQGGDSPLVIDVPHAGTYVPAALRPRLTAIAQTVPDTDWHVEKLYAFAAAEGATLFCATHSRYVVDLNRDPSGAALYAGADNTELCPTRTFAGEAIYVGDSAPTNAEVAERTAACFAPYHAALAEELVRVRERHGFAVLLDGHSIRGVVPRFFEGRLPDLNLGTASGASCMPELQACAARVLAEAEGFTHIVNGRFKGGWITRHYGRPQAGVHALQLEMAQDCYMDEAPPFHWDSGRAGRLAGVLQRLVHALMAFRPPV